MTCRQAILEAHLRAGCTQGEAEACLDWVGSQGESHLLVLAREVEVGGEEAFIASAQRSVELGRGTRRERN